MLVLLASPFPCSAWLGTMVCTSGLDNEIHMNDWCMIAMYICCAFELINWPLMQRLVGDLKYAL